jgi:hypothetical protein
MIQGWNWTAILGLVIAKFFAGQIITFLVLLAFNITVWTLNPSQGVTYYIGSTPHLVALVLTGLVLNFICGYLVAMWTPTRKMAHAVLLAFLIFLMGYLVQATSTGISYPLWFTSSRFLTIPAVILGAWWRIKTHGLVTLLTPKNKQPANLPLLLRLKTSRWQL